MREESAARSCCEAHLIQECRNLPHANPMFGLRKVMRENILVIRHG